MTVNSLSDYMRTQISEIANLRSWFAFKDWIVASNLDPNLKASIISYGTSLMMNRYNHVLP